MVFYENQWNEVVDYKEQKLKMAHTIVRKLIHLITNVLVPILIFSPISYTPFSLSKNLHTKWGERERERSSAVWRWSWEEHLSCSASKRGRQRGQRLGDCLGNIIESGVHSSQIEKQPTWILFSDDSLPNTTRHWITESGGVNFTQVISTLSLSLGGRA